MLLVIYMVKKLLELSVRNNFKRLIKRIQNRKDNEKNSDRNDNENTKSKFC